MHFPRLAHMETILPLQGWGHSCRHHYVWTLRFPGCSWDSQDGQVNLSLWAWAWVLSLEMSRLGHACSIVSLHATYKMSREKKKVEMMAAECDNRHHPLCVQGPVWHPTIFKPWILPHPHPTQEQKEDEELCFKRNTETIMPRSHILQNSHPWKPLPLPGWLSSSLWRQTLAAFSRYRWKIWGYSLYLSLERKGHESTLPKFPAVPVTITPTAWSS